MSSRAGRVAVTSKDTSHSFTLFLAGSDVFDDEHLDALHEAGCDDAVMGERDGAQYAAFDREAESFGAALASAIHDVTGAVPALRIARIEPDELVTLAAIAERSERSRESVRLLSTGKRGPGGFPSPVIYADHKTRLWRWAEVVRWLAEHGKAGVEIDGDAARLVAALNSAYDLREHRRSLSDKRDVALVAEALGDGWPVEIPAAWRGDRTGAPQPDRESIVRDSRDSH